MDSKGDFLRRSADTLAQIYENIISLPVLKLADVEPHATALVIVDMVNGFVKEGALYSARVEGLIPAVTAICRACDELNIVKLAFADHHAADAAEFSTYPAHCIAGTQESEIIDELKQAGCSRLIAKNSTNGFLEREFQNWLQGHDGFHTFIIVGCCTDICIQQFATTLKTWFNMENRQARIIIPANAVETYDFAMHNGDLMQVMALYYMMSSGIEVVSGVE